MQTTNIRNQFNLHGKKISLLALCFFLMAGSFAYGQRNKINLPGHDDKNIRYGFQLAAHMFDMRVRQASSTVYNAWHASNYSKQGNPNNISAEVVSNYSPGFSIGFTLNKALLDELWDVRFTPTVSFHTRKVNFPTYEVITEDSIVWTATEAALGQTFIELPIMLRYKSLRRGNSRFYLTGGIIPSIEVGGKKAKDNPEEFLLKRQNFEVAYGIGFESFMRLFKLAPEIRFSHGLPNIKLANQYEHIGLVDKFSSHRISFIFNFE